MSTRTPRETLASLRRAVIAPYFLGAWLLYALDHFSTRDGPAEFLIYDLALSVDAASNTAREEWHQDRLKLGTAEQLEVGSRFLDLVEGEPDLASFFGDLSAGRAFRRQSWERRWEA